MQIYEMKNGPFVNLYQIFVNLSQVLCISSDHRGHNKSNNPFQNCCLFSFLSK